MNIINVSRSLLILFIVFCSSASFASINIPLKVSESAGVSRILEPVTSGVPLPESERITDIANLVLKDSRGNLVQCQLRVLSRWHGLMTDASKPIKWVLIDFQATVSSKASATYYLTNGIYSVGTGINVTDVVGSTTIETGAITFTVSKTAFNLFDSVQIVGDNSPIISSNTFAGVIITRDNTAPVNKAGTYSSANSIPTIATVEESGPIRTVVLVRGHIASSGSANFVGGDARQVPSDGRPGDEQYPLGYTCRITAYKGKSYVKVAYTLENDGNHLSYYYPTNDVFMEGNFLRVIPTLGAFLTVKENGFTGSMTNTGSFYMMQRHTSKNATNETLNFSYTDKLNGSDVYTGTRSPGWVDVTDSNRGMAVGMKNLWQNYPKGVAYKGGIFDLEVLPDHDWTSDAPPIFTTYSTGRHWFSGGIHKTTESLYYFHGPATTDQANIYTGFQNPLFAQALPSWYSSTMAAGIVNGRSTVTSKDSRQQSAIDNFEQYQEMLVDPTKEPNGHDIVKLREIRNQGIDHYGWRNFGDMAWGGPLYSSNHYDWPFSLFQNFIRSGDRRYLDRALEGVNHTSDMDLIHFHGGYYTRYDGTWQWEQGTEAPLHESRIASGFRFSHTWTDGLTLGYFLTGDPRYKEDFDRTCNAIIAAYSLPGPTNFFGSVPVTGLRQSQTRTISWPIEMLVNRYRAEGDNLYLIQANTLFEKGLLFTEQGPKYNASTCNKCIGSLGGGYITNPADGQGYDGKAVVTFLTYPLEPLCNLHYEMTNAGMDTTILAAYLERSLDWLQSFALVGGVIDGNGNYSMKTSSYAVDPSNFDANNGGQLAHNIHMASAFGYGYLIKKTSDTRTALRYLATARNLFKDIMLYRTVNPSTKNTYYNPNSYSAVSWGWLPTATKEMGYIARSGQYYLEAEKESQLIHKPH